MPVSQEEMNQYIKNMTGDIQLPELEAHHAGNVRQYLIENLSKVGRFAHRDFERFGNLHWQDPRIEVHGRQDGWQAATKEVSDIDQLTYGTGILYVHGEMEIPDDEDTPKDQIHNDEFYHMNRAGKQYIYKTVDTYYFWNTDPSATGSSGNVGDKGPMVGFKWEWIEEIEDGDVLSNDGANKWTWATIKENVGGFGYDPDLDDKYGISPAAVPNMPPEFNNNKVYNIDNERHHFPYQIINSGQALSVDTLLDETLRDKNGMYDDIVPLLARDHDWPPEKGIKYPSGKEEIVDYISQIEETP